MNTMRTIGTGLTLGVLLFSGSVTVAFAKETSQNFVINQNLNYFWNRWNADQTTNLQSEASVIAATQNGGGWELGLSNPNITILYRANVINNATGASLTDLSNIAVGTVLRLEFEPHLSSDISWFGTGASMDSPYGEWRANAAPPALTMKNYGGGSAALPDCDPKDYVTSVAPLGIPLSIYIPFVVNPPTKSITTSSNLSCGAADANGNKTCTVTAAGPISVTFDFGSTYGKFYYRYIDQRNPVYGAPVYAAYAGCYGNNVALRPAGTSFIAQSQPVCWTECTQETCVPPPTNFDYGDTGTYYGGSGVDSGVKYRDSYTYLP